MTDQPMALRGKRLHFVGIGGCGMSGLAHLTKRLGAVCGGSDIGQSTVTDDLEADGIPVTLDQSGAAIPEDCDLLVASAAIKAEHPERVTAAERGIGVMKYAQMLGKLMLGRTGVAIAGTHGKSTTTAMLAHALIVAEQDPSFIVGATCAQIGGGWRVGREDLLLAEACEYDRSFHNFHPTFSAVLNVEEDHLDIYGSLDGVVEAFNTFAKLTDPAGLLLIGHESAYRTAVAAGAPCNVETIGFAPEADYAIETRPVEGAQRVTLTHHGEPLTEFDLKMPGEHMAANAATAAALATRLGASPDRVGEALTGFAGLDRRMQVLGERDGVTVIDDYGHHPTEIAVTLRALRRFYKPQQQGGRVICVFQPHQHSRTRFLMEQFATSFSDADVVVVPHIYFVRDTEADREQVTAGHLVARLQDRGVDAHHIDGFDEIVGWLRKQTRPGDLVVVMGAGPVWQVGRGFMGSAE